jgi:uncharacterized integral membrane protein
MVESWQLLQLPLLIVLLMDTVSGHLLMVILAGKVIAAFE